MADTDDASPVRGIRPPHAALFSPAATADSRDRKASDDPTCVGDPLDRAQRVRCIASREVRDEGRHGAPDCLPHAFFASSARSDLPPENWPVFRVSPGR